MEVMLFVFVVKMSRHLDVRRGLIKFLRFIFREISPIVEMTPSNYLIPNSSGLALQKQRRLRKKLYKSNMRDTRLSQAHRLSPPFRTAFPGFII
jgi:hypothetical protein